MNMKFNVCFPTKITAVIVFYGFPYSCLLNVEVFLLLAETTLQMWLQEYAKFQTMHVYQCEEGIKVIGLAQRQG